MRLLSVWVYPWLLLGCMLLKQALAAEPAVERPTQGEIRDAVRRLLGPKQEISLCHLAPRAHGYNIECSRTECHSCNVTHVITTLIRKEGRWLIAGTRRERRGDTGECGCCM